MSISGVSHANTQNFVSRDNRERQEISGQRQEAAAELSIKHKTPSFREMSRSEFDSLIREGKIDMRLSPLILPSSGLDLTKDTKAQMESVYEQKIDFIAHFHKRVEFQKTQPGTEPNREALRFYTEGLNMLTKLQVELEESNLNVKG